MNDNHKTLEKKENTLFACLLRVFTKRKFSEFQSKPKTELFDNSLLKGDNGDILWTWETVVFRKLCRQTVTRSVTVTLIHYCFKTIMDRTLLNVSCLILIKKLARWVRVWAVLDRYSNTISLRPWEFSTMWDRGKHKHLTPSPPG